jgi:hypothetical protein
MILYTGIHEYVYYCITTKTYPDTTVTATGNTTSTNTITTTTATRNINNNIQFNSKLSQSCHLPDN